MVYIWVALITGMGFLIMLQNSLYGYVIASPSRLKNNTVIWSMATVSISRLIFWLSSSCCSVISSSLNLTCESYNYYMDLKHDYTDVWVIDGIVLNDLMVDQRYCCWAFSFFSVIIRSSSLIDLWGSSPLGHVTVHMPMFSHSLILSPFDNSSSLSSEYWSLESMTHL